MKTRWMAGAVAAVLAGVLLTGGCSDQKSSGPEEAMTGDPSSEVARVNGETITLGEVNRIVQAWRTGQFAQIDASAPEAELQERALDELIGQKVLYQAAVKSGAGPSDEEVQTTISMMKSQFPDEATFQGALQQQGVTEEELVHNFRMDSAIRKYIRVNIQDTVRVTPEQARAWYDAHPEEFEHPEQVHGGHILVRVGPEASPADVADARRRAEEIHRELRAGADFARIASEKSEDPGSAARGGDLGFFSRGQMVAPFDSAAFALRPGQLSGPVRSNFGFHVIKIEDSRPAGVLPYEQVEQHIMQRLAGERTSERLEDLVAELKGEAKIKRKS